MSLVIKPLSPALGAEIVGVDLRKELPKQTVADIVDAWHQHLVVVFRNQSLSEDDLYLIMTGPPDAVVREYQALLKMDGVDLRFSDEGMRSIAQYCLRRRTGARSLRTIVEEICHDVMFEAPERKGETVTIDAQAVESHLERLDGVIERDE